MDPRYVDRLLNDTVDSATIQTIKSAIQEHNS